MLIVGFDPGITGAVAALCETKHGGVTSMHAEVHDLPTNSFPVRNQTTGEIRVHRKLDGHGLWARLNHLLRELDSHEHEVKFVIEDVRHLSGTAAGGHAMASLMHSKGVIEGVCSTFGHATFFVDAQKWQRMFGIKGGAKGKQASLEAARRLYPGLAGGLGRVKDQNRSDAVLIAHWGLRALDQTDLCQ